jgi:hypothetical protein
VSRPGEVVQHAFVDEGTGLSVLVVLGRRAAWATLADPEGQLIGDAWLYNVGPAPEAIDLTAPPGEPAPNAAHLSRPLAQPPGRAKGDFDVRFTLNGELFLADVFLRGEWLARLSPGSQPGWATHAAAPGPFAHPLDATEAPLPRKP